MFVPIPLLISNMANRQFKQLGTGKVPRKVGHFSSNLQDAKRFLNVIFGYPETRNQKLIFDLYTLVYPWFCHESFFADDFRSILRAKI